MSNFQSRLTEHFQKLAQKKVAEQQHHNDQTAREGEWRREFIKFANSNILPLFHHVASEYTAGGFQLEARSFLTEHDKTPSVGLEATVRQGTRDEQWLLSFSLSQGKVCMEDIKTEAYPQYFEYTQITNEFLQERVLNFVQNVWVV
jgi:hypothetical protein